jgi:tetratricopeptide (TPR) repeat protein
MKRSFITALFTAIFVLNVNSQTEKKDSSAVKFEKAQIINSNVNDFFNKYVVFPDDLLPDSKNQNVVISFIILRDGQIDSVKVLKNPSKSATYQTLAVLEKSVGKWIPTKINGIPVDKKYYASFNYIFSNDYSDKVRKANNLLKKGENEKALKAINEAINFNEYEAESYQIRSQIYKNLNKIDLEKEDLKKIESLNKDLIVSAWVLLYGVRR